MDQTCLDIIYILYNKKIWHLQILTIRVLKKDKVRAHIASFKGTLSHYSLTASKIVYLPVELNIRSIHKLFLEKYPEFKNPVTFSEQSYREIFNNEYNVRFGHLRKDTCSTCDSYRMQLVEVEKKLPFYPLLQSKINKLESEQVSHKTEANNFYER